MNFLLPFFYKVYASTNNIALLDVPLSMNDHDSNHKNLRLSENLMHSEINLYQTPDALFLSQDKNRIDDQLLRQQIFRHSSPYSNYEESQGTEQKEYPVIATDKNNIINTDQKNAVQAVGNTIECYSRQENAKTNQENLENKQKLNLKPNLPSKNISNEGCFLSYYPLSSQKVPNTSYTEAPTYSIGTNLLHSPQSNIIDKPDRIKTPISHLENTNINDFYNSNTPQRMSLTQAEETRTYCLTVQKCDVFDKKFPMAIKYSTGLKLDDKSPIPKSPVKLKRQRTEYGTKNNGVEMRKRAKKLSTLSSSNAEKNSNKKNFYSRNFSLKKLLNSRIKLNINQHDTSGPKEVLMRIQVLSSLYDNKGDREIFTSYISENDNSGSIEKQPPEKSSRILLLIDFYHLLNVLQGVYEFNSKSPFVLMVDIWMMNLVLEQRNQVSTGSSLLESLITATKICTLIYSMQPKCFLNLITKNIKMLHVIKTQKIYELQQFIESLTLKECSIMNEIRSLQTKDKSIPNYYTLEFKRDIIESNTQIITGTNKVLNNMTTIVDFITELKPCTLNALYSGKKKFKALINRLKEKYHNPNTEVNIPELLVEIKTTFTHIEFLLVFTFFRNVKCSKKYLDKFWNFYTGKLSKSETKLKSYESETDNNVIKYKFDLNDGNLQIKIFIKYLRMYSLLRLNIQIFADLINNLERELCTWKSVFEDNYHEK